MSLGFGVWGLGFRQGPGFGDDVLGVRMGIRQGC